MKKCSGCKQEKPLTHFYKSSHHSQGVQTYCKECNKLWVRRRYLKNKEYYNLVNKKTKKRNRELVVSHLLTHPCIDCGEKDPVVLEFDHVGEKKNTVCVSISRLHCIERLLHEISQCEVRCANCHRRKTAREKGYYRYFGE